MEWPPEFILTRLRQLARLKLQPPELLAVLRELALQYKANKCRGAAGGVLSRSLVDYCAC
jgi:hypothetical protein